MTAVLVIFTAVVAFIIGIFVGVKKEPPIIKKKINAKSDEDLQVLMTQYQNFLYYDGSAQ